MWCVQGFYVLHCLVSVKFMGQTSRSLTNVGFAGILCFALSG